MIPSLFKNKIFLGFIILIIGGSAYWMISKKSSTPERAQTYQELRDRVDAEDKKILREKLADYNLIYTALIRQAQVGDAYALQKALDLSRSDVHILRVGATSALGYYDDAQAFARLQEMLSDKDLDVRIAAINSLAFKPSAERQQILLNLSQKSSLNVREKIAVLQSLIRLQKDPKVAQALGEKLFTLAMSPEASSVSNNIVVSLMSTLPTLPPLLTYLEKIAKSGKDHPLLPLVLRHLASTRNPWLVQNFSQFTTHKNPAVRMSAIQMLLTLCPKDRWSVIERGIWEERDRSITLVALQVAEQLKGARALGLLQKAVDDTTLSETERATAKRSLELIKDEANSSDICEGRD